MNEARLTNLESVLSLLTKVQEKHPSKDLDNAINILKLELTSNEDQSLLSSALDMIIKMAALDFGNTLQLTGSDDTYDALAAGLNMLSEELRHSVVAKQILIEQQEFTKKFFDLATFGLNLSKIDGTWIEPNRSLLTMIGYTLPEASGKLNYSDITPKEYEELGNIQEQQLRDAGHYGPYEIEFIRKDGSKISVRTSGFAIERNGEQFVWSMIEDISAQKESRKALIASAKMASLGEMAAGIAHEINNPLAIICAKSRQLGRKVLAGRTQPQQLADELAKVESTAFRIAKIVKGLRSFSRDSDDDPMESVPVYRIIEDTLELCRERFKFHSIELTLECPKEICIECRATQISQVLMNLLGNAFDAVADLQEKWVRIAVTSSSSVVQIAITDSGRGIPKEIVNNLMLPFYTTKDATKGTGLGLSISKGLTEKHQGRLYYRLSGINTCFVVDLPLVQHAGAIQEDRKGDVA